MTFKKIGEHMFDCVIVMAGSGKRASLGYNKALVKINNESLFMYSVQKFMSIKECAKIILVCNIDDAGTVKEKIKKCHFPIEIVIGGPRRQDSVLEGVKQADNNIVLIHDAARPFVLVSDIIKLYQTIEKENKWATLSSKVVDTIKEVGKETKTLDRKMLYAISTPQAVFKDEYITYANDCINLDLVDDMQPFEIVRKENPIMVLQENNNFKITTPKDIEYAKSLLEGKKNMNYKTGLGYDIHRLGRNRKLILAGVNIPYELGLIGHSDGDVVYHAIMNAILGALGKGDIGEHFPDTSEEYKDIDSKILFEEVVKLLKNEKYHIGNLDVSIICQRPKLLNYKKQMVQNIASICEISEDKVNVKANTNEGMDAIGKGLAIACLANILIYCEE